MSRGQVGRAADPDHLGSPHACGHSAGSNQSEHKLEKIWAQNVKCNPKAVCSSNKTMEMTRVSKQKFERMTKT